MRATDALGGAVPRPPGPAARSPDGGFTVLVAASGFKEGLGPREAATAITEGIHAASPSSRVLHVPVIDGGEGFAEEIVRTSTGTIERLYVADPFGKIVTAHLGLIGRGADRTAVIGIEEAADLRRLPPERRDATRASSRGVGQLIAAALDRGVRRIVIGCGDTGANDGGIGMAAELGVRFFDASRTEIVEAGGLQRLATIDLSLLDGRLQGVSIEAVVNPFDDLFGEHGVTHYFGALKGASQAQVRRLEGGLARYADVIERMLGIDVTKLAGGGASGGLGAGLAVFAGARLTSRVDFLQHSLALEDSFAVADLAITAAGGDHGPAAGNVPAWVVRRAEALGLPVIALAGAAAAPAQSSGGDRGSAPAIAPAPVSRDEGLARTGEWLRDASARAMRTARDTLVRGSGLRVPSRTFAAPAAARG